MNVVEWLERRQGVILPARGNARPGPVDLELTPYLRKPMEMFTDPTVERLGCCFARQLGKTTWLFSVTGYIIDYDPGPTLLYYPTQDIAKAVSRDRFQPMIRGTPTLSRHMTGQKADFQLLSYTFDRLTIRYGHAGSEVAGRSHPIRYLIKDETSAMTKSSSANVDDTTSSFWNRKVVEASTPMDEKDNMWRFLGLKAIDGLKGEQLWDTDAYEPKSATTVFFFHVPCPRCGKMIQLVWRQLRWPTDVALRDLPTSGWYECQECGGRIDDVDKRGMLEKGEWRTHKSQSGRTHSKWVGFILPKMYGLWDSCSFGAVAAAGVRSRISKDIEVIARFVNNFLALPYSIEQESIDLVSEEAIEPLVKAYHRNTIPEPCRVLTLGADVGTATASGVHWIVQGFGPKGESWRISWGRFDDLFQLEDYLKTATFQHPKAGKMVILCGAIDSRYRKPDVLAFCRKFRNRIFPIQGERYVKVKVDGGNASFVPHKAYHPERGGDGKPLPDSMIGFRLNTVFWKQWLYGRINLAHGQEETFFLPMERDATLEKHLRSEEEVLVRKRGSAEVERAWVRKTGYENNHYLDAVIYGIAIADVFQLMNHAENGPVYTGIKETQSQSKTSRTANPMGFGDMRF